MHDLFLLIIGAIVLGLAIALKDAASNRWYARRSRIRRRVQVVVVVDSTRRSRRRTVFWKPALRTADHNLSSRTRVHYLSISDELRKGRNPSTRLMSAAKTDVIVVNWDAINGDPVYGSDRSLHLVAHYRPDLRHWLNQGGLLVVEAQGISWGAASEPYRVFTSLFPEDESRVTLCTELWKTGKVATIHEDYADHPLVRGMAAADLALRDGGLWERRRWFPRRRLSIRSWLRLGRVDSLDYIERYQGHLYRGWFTEWSADWKPVLLASNPPDIVDSAPRAILLSRRVRAPNSGPDRANGAIVLTTMFLASAELRQLFANLVTFADHPDEREMPGTRVVTSDTDD